jgi:hypothetical protein
MEAKKEMSTVAGIYRNGKIELLEMPEGVREGRVRVTLVEEAKRERSPQYLIPGKYKMGRFSTLEDFREAEGRGEPLFDEL